MAAMKEVHFNICLNHRCNCWF